jgi:hypothetical protein
MEAVGAFSHAVPCTGFPSSCRLYTVEIRSFRETRYRSFGKCWKLLSSFCKTSSTSIIIQKVLYFIKRNKTTQGSSPGHAGRFLPNSIRNLFPEVQADSVPAHSEIRPHHAIFSLLNHLQAAITSDDRPGPPAPGSIRGPSPALRPGNA